ncbi:P-loop NTPase family protein [Salegentibacter salegens]|uniref:DNA replication protein DnaC n=1 Tax=Salegentibacter salegens TaxID=143223 RepID=A0A1M7IL34_9FLAO|nr:ATP-binding protein [Salegentibacter salegens]PRX42490.1 hypothetical protein LY58_02757 [Salegentibacter salegens]SHM41365.1 hypothetical protein SAMN05878281_0597 [Salegentibacter salegens]
MINTVKEKKAIKIPPPVIRLSKPAPLINKQLFWHLFLKQVALQKIDFKIEKHNEKIVYCVFRYFLQMENFNEYGIIKNKASLSKGLLVYGDYGVGKSTLFDLIHEVGKEIIKTFHIAQLWFPRISAISMVTQYHQSHKDPSSTFVLQDNYKAKLFIDDLGKEEKAFNREELIEKVLFERHRRKRKTFVTTNDTPSAIAKRYGAHIGDRLPEMFNIIKWEGGSWRE